MSLPLPVSSIAIAFAALPVALLIAACAGGDGEPGAPPGENTDGPRVVTSLGIFADFVREIGGDRIDVSSLLPPGADPHTFEPSPSDIRRITEADIIFINDDDPGVEGSILSVIQANKDSATLVVPFRDSIQTSGTSISDNPHLWLSPTFARSYVGIIEETLTGVDPAGATDYGANLTRYEDRLSQLDAEIAAAVEEIPPQNRKLVTSHDAFRHLAQRYNLEMVGFVVPGPGQDPSPGEIAELSNAITDQDVPAVFTEPQIGADSRLLEQIADDTGVQVCTLYSDALNDDVPTYIDMMRFNADELLRCLGDAGG